MKNEKKPTGFLKWEKEDDCWTCENHNIMILKTRDIDGLKYQERGYDVMSTDGEEYLFFECTLREAKLAAEQHIIENLKIQIKKAHKLKLI